MERLTGFSQERKFAKVRSGVVRKPANGPQRYRKISRKPCQNESP